VFPFDRLNAVLVWKGAPLLLITPSTTHNGQFKSFLLTTQLNLQSYNTKGHTIINPGNNHSPYIMLSDDTNIITETLKRVSILGGDKKSIKKEKYFRANFGSNHNATPVTLARSIFHQPFYLKDEVEYNKYKNEPRRQMGGAVTSSGQKVVVGQNLNRNIMRAVVERFLSYMLITLNQDLFYNRTRRENWDPVFQGSSGSFVNETPFTVGCRIHLYCRQCQLRDKMSLVAVLKPIKLDDGDDIYGKLGIEVEELYYHSICKSTEGNRLQYNHNKFCTVQIACKDVVEDTYDNAIKAIEDFDPPPSFLDNDLDSREWNKIKKNRELWPEGRADPVEAATKLADHPSPPGEYINFGVAGYDYDDRKYMMLPTVNEEYDVNDIQHLSVLAKVGYLICQSMGIEDEFAPFLFDVEAYKSDLNKSSKKGEKKGDGIRWKTNEGCHLSLREVSLLFAGHEVRVVGENPVHQRVHTDCEKHKRLGSNVALKGKCWPGSFLFPLQRKRGVYVHNEAMVLQMLLNQMLLFRGDLGHGGLTRRESSWDVAIHGHLDSRHHTRVQGVLSVERARGSYLPYQHLCEYDVHAFVEYFQSEVDWMSSLLGRGRDLRVAFHRHLRSTKRKWKVSGKQKNKIRTVMRMMETMQKADPFRTDEEVMAMDDEEDGHTNDSEQEEDDEEDGSEDEEEGKEGGVADISDASEEKKHSEEEPIDQVVEEKDDSEQEEDDEEDGSEDEEEGKEGGVADISDAAPMRRSKRQKKND
jgi:hypothetical protein